MKRFNLNEFLWFLTLTFLDISIINLVYAGKIKFYIGSNIIKYMYFTIVILSIITISQVKNIFTSKGSINIRLKLIPIILAIILGTISVNNLKTFKHSELNNEIRENRTSSIEQRSLYEYEFDYKLNNDKKNISADSERSLSKNKNQETVIINENNPIILEDLRINPQKYIGKKLEIHGFVCKENYLSSNQFIIGRIIMTCCAADSKVVGIVGEYYKASELEESENVKVVGTIGISTINDENNVIHKIPVVIIEKIESEN